MGRLIDSEYLKEDMKRYGWWHVDSTVKEYVDGLDTVEAIPKDQYEARLKADMVAMLEDLDLQIDESAAYNLEVAKVQRLIRDRIDKLKEDKE